LFCLGCGKTTQVPQYIYDNWKAQTSENQSELGDCNILVSQPRKIAAITIAQRVADERKSRIGDLVGYQVGLKRELDKGLDVNKFDNKDRTKILFCTTGVILQRLIHERSMQRYSHIIIDEIHERDIDTGNSKKYRS
jgi:ATP-dependent RNA helicase TDRD9